MITRRFDETHTLSNICSVAANRFKENAAVARGSGHDRLAEQFDIQEKEARELADLFMNAEPFSVVHEP